MKNLKSVVAILVMFMMVLTMMPNIAFANEVDYSSDYISGIQISTGTNNTVREVTRNGSAFSTLVSSTDSKFNITVTTGKKFDSDAHKIVVEYNEWKGNTQQEQEQELKANSESTISGVLKANARPGDVKILIKDNEDKTLEGGEYTLKINLKAELASLSVKSTDNSKTYLSGLTSGKTDYDINITEPVGDVRIVAGGMTQKNFYSLKIGGSSATIYDIKNKTSLNFDASGEVTIPIEFALKTAETGDSSTTYNLKFKADFDCLMFSAAESGSSPYDLDRKFTYNDNAEYTLKIPITQNTLFLYGVQKGKGPVTVSYNETSVKGKYGFADLSNLIGEEKTDKSITIKSGDEEYKVNIVYTVALDNLSVKNGEDELITEFETDRTQYAALVSGDCGSIKVKPEYQSAYTVKINGEESQEVVPSWSSEGTAEVTVEVIYGEKKTEYRILLIKETEDISPILLNTLKDVTYNVGDTAKALSIEALAPKKGSLTYQWQAKIEENGEASNISGASESEYTPDTKRAGTKWISCKIVNAVEGETKEIVTDWIKVSVNATKAETPKLTDRSLSDKTYTIGETSTFLFYNGATVSDGGTLTVQWYVSDSKYYNKGIELEDTENVSLYFPNTSELGTKYYYYAVTNTLQGFTATAYSDFAEITVVDERNDLEGLAKDSTQKNTYFINDLDDLETISKYVKNGNNLYGYTFKLTTDDIVLPTDWEPIGTLKSGASNSENGKNVLPFSGKIDGQNHKITVSDGGLPLLGYVREATIKNLDIYGKKIAGYGLINNYSVDYAGGDRDTDFSSRYLYTAVIENVRILSGTQVLQSGFVGGFASGANKIYLTNCEVQENVIIGYDEKQNNIGSLAGSFNGSVANCKSKATVKGENNVGGLIGSKGQSMGDFSVKNSSFEGKIIATGNSAGGIVGSGYSSDSAPNTKCVSIQNCFSSADITGKEYVGGILGSERGIVQCWANGTGYIQDNHFAGRITATSQYVGGVIGYMNALDKFNVISNNYYIINGCGAETGIGFINEQNVDLTSQAYGRNDDPLNKDKDKLSSGLSASAFSNKTLMGKLNKSNTSFKNWIQGTSYPIHSDEPVLYEIELSGTYKTEYKTGDTFSTEGMVITGKLSDGSTRTISLDDEKLEFTGYNMNKRGVQTVTVKYGVASTTYDITVLYNESQLKDIYVYFTLLGDKAHGNPTEATGTHTLNAGNLDTWIERTQFTITNNTTVKDVFEKALTQKGMTWSNPTGNYVESITRNGVTLAEFTNGQNSGWMYTLNGTQSLLGVEEQFLNNGDVIVFHYTDDYTKEEGSDKWGVPGAVEEVKDVTTDKKAGTTTSPTDVKLSEKTNADGTKETVATVTVSAENQKEILAQAKSNKSKEIILQVSKDSVKDASKADVQLDKSFIESVLKDTEAKLTVKTPFGDKTYTQDELKALAAAAAGKTVSLEIVKSEKTDEELKAEQLEAAKATVAKASMKARSTKTAKGNVKVVFKPDTKTQNFIQEMKDMGYTVKYRFYRSTKKSSGYKAMLTKTSKTYTNTSGKKGTRYYYKVQVRVYDENGKCVAKTALKQCKYATRIFG